MNMSLDICILTHNRKEQLLLTLENRVQQMGDCANIFVLDNGSNDGTDEAVRQSDFFNQITFVKSSKNRGVCRGRNILWRMSDSDFLLSMDDDMILSRESIFTLINICMEDSSIAIVSPLIIDSQSGRIHNPIRKERANDVRLYENCFLLRRSALKRIGYLDRKLKYAGEGWDYAQRVVKLGYTIRRAPEVKVFHYDRIRQTAEDAERRLSWVWSFAYVYSKNLTSVKAVLFTARNCAAHLRSGTPLFGLRFALAIPGRAWSGMRAGRIEKARLSGRSPTL